MRRISNSCVDALGIARPRCSSRNNSCPATVQVPRHGMRADLEYLRSRCEVVTGAMFASETTKLLRWPQWAQSRRNLGALTISIPGTSRTSRSVPLIAGGELALLHERLRTNQLAGGWIKGSHFGEACAAIYLEGELVPSRTWCCATPHGRAHRLPWCSPRNVGAPRPAPSSTARGEMASHLIGHWNADRRALGTG
jgi:hypothetical protein